MTFTYHSPDPRLRKFIQTYWELRGSNGLKANLDPDCCIDIIINLGITWKLKNHNITIEQGCVYLGGALTESVYESIPKGVYLIGIRFNPGYFNHFYPFFPLADFRNDCIKINSNDAPMLNKLTNDPFNNLNIFYLQRYKEIFNPIFSVIPKIISNSGNTSLPEIAANIQLSIRQTERLFNKLIGLTPKQFCNIIKYMQTQRLLINKDESESLLSIAIESGYYDHAHFTKSYKKITNRTPKNK